MRPSRSKRSGGDPWSPPRIGQRMLKTAAAVFLCLIFYYLRGYRGEDMPTEAAVTAIICMQPYVQDSRRYALDRLTGTLIGAAWGLLFLFVLLLFPILGRGPAVLYGLMALGVLVSLYTAVAFHKPDSSGLAAIVFICVVIAFPELDDPLRDALDRILGVLVGTVIAIGVNVAHLPRDRDRHLVFFLRSSDLVPDRFAQISPAVRFRLDALYRDGAKICLISRHAPAFFTSQMSALSPGLPMIVMDGAALYDVREGRYLQAETIRPEDSSRILARLDDLGQSCFLYTIHRDRTCIFHRGDLTGPERAVLDRLRRTPYRRYLDEEVYDPGEIVCIKVIGGDGEIDQLRKRLFVFIQAGKLRCSIQPQTGCPGTSGLYIYSRRATVHLAEGRLLRMLREQDPGLEAVELFLPSGYRSEHDAMLLLYHLTDRYAPPHLVRVLRSLRRHG